LAFQTGILHQLSGGFCLGKIDLDPYPNLKFQIGTSKDDEANTMAKPKKALISTERIEKAILLIRGEKVMLDADLAALYGVETRSLLQAVKRNRSRFPRDFMFQLSNEELESLRSQIVISNIGRGGRRYRPYAFTEQGVAMLSSVLRSPRAVEVNIAIMRAFVTLRRWAIEHADLARRIDELESKYDQKFAVVFDAIRKLMELPPLAPTKEMGFHTIGRRPTMTSRRIK
jgi:hypothetical protein